MTEAALRVLMIAPTPYFSDRGCHVRIYEEARALTKLGHEVCIVTYHLGRDMPGIRVVRIPRIPWYSKLEAGPSWHKPYLDLLLLWRCCKEIRSFRPHLIHAHLHEGALIGYIIKRIYGIPFLFDYQGSLSGESLNHGFFKASSPLMRLFRSVERFIDHAADCIVTSSDGGRLELVEEWGVDPARVINCIDGVDTEVFSPHLRAEARRELGIADQAKLVVYLGLFSRYQGLDLLLDAIVVAREKAPEVRYLLMGFPDGEYRSKAAALAIDDVITFTGRVPYDRAAWYLSAGDLAVSPKLAATEANGKLFNYMACGLPTLVFDSIINREILGDDGVYVQHGNTKLFAEAIVSLVHDPERLKELSGRLRERAVNLNSWHARAQQLVAAYRALPVTPSG